MELELIRWLRQRLPSTQPLILGLGDDASLIDWPSGEQCVVTTDMLMAGVHFPAENPDLQRVGRKALAVNLSDIAAMAARPVAAYVSLAIPRGFTSHDVQQLYEGMLPLADRHRVSIAGGDTNVWSGALVINVVVLGACRPGQALRRDGARAGDAILVTGSLGGSILGKHFDFEPRVQEAQQIMARGAIHAGCDLSDGLALDLWRILEASGVGAVINGWQVPVSSAAHELAKRDPASGSPLEHALSDGEDFELLLIADAEQSKQLLESPPCALEITQVGTITAEPGLWIRNSPAETPVPLAPRGYEHR